MDKDVIEELAWIGKGYVSGSINGIVLSFHGLGRGLKDSPTIEEFEWARNGALVVYPYYGPWAWMNRQTRAMLDELVNAVYDSYGLPDKTPLICTGESMGGLGSLLYARYAKHPIKACLANSPVCDLHFHFHERTDVPPTIRWAFQGYPEALDHLLSEHSPLDQLAAMPDIPYRIVHGEGDTAVSKLNHSDRMVAAMRGRKLQVEYIEVAGMGHCEPLPPQVIAGDIEFVTSAMSS